ARGWPLPPQTFDQAVTRNDLVAMQEQDREERALFRAADVDRPVVAARLNRAQDPKFHERSVTGPDLRSDPPTTCFRCRSAQTRPVRPIRSQEVEKVKKLALAAGLAGAALSLAGATQAAATPAVGHFQTSGQFVADDLSAACGATVTIAYADTGTYQVL